MLKLDVTTIHTETRCPTCGKKLDASTGPNAPRPDDLSVCCYCLTFLRYGPSLSLRELRPDEFEALTASEQSDLRTAHRVLARGSDDDECGRSFLVRFVECGPVLLGHLLRVGRHGRIEIDALVRKVPFDAFGRRLRHLRPQHLSIH